MKNKTSALLDTLKSSWRFFLPMWLSPIIYLFGGVLAHNYENLSKTIYYCAVSLFFVSLSISIIPLFRKKIPFWHSAFFGVVTPFLIWLISCSIYPGVMNIKVLL
jgi:hypothetical protein